MKPLGNPPNYRSIEDQLPPCCYTCIHSRYFGRSRELHCEAFSQEVTEFFVCDRFKPDPAFTPAIAPALQPDTEPASTG